MTEKETSVETENLGLEKVCGVCQGPLPAGSRASRLTCSSRCRQTKFNRITRGSAAWTPGGRGRKPKDGVPLFKI